MSTAITAAEKVDGFTRRSVRKAQKQKRSQGSSQFRSQSSQVELFPLPQLKGTFPRLHEASRRAWPEATGALVVGRVAFPGLSRVGGRFLAEPRSLLSAPSLPSLLFRVHTWTETTSPRSFSPFNLLSCQGKKKGGGEEKQPFLSTFCRTALALTFHYFSLVSRTFALDRIERSFGPVESTRVFTFLWSVIQVDADNSWLFGRVGDKRGTG